MKLLGLESAENQAIARAKQDAFLLAYFTVNMHLGAAAGQCGLSPNTVYDWIANDRQFRSRLSSAHLGLAIKAEAKLAQLIESEDEAVALRACHIVLNARGKHLGYGTNETPRDEAERPVIEINDETSQAEATQAFMALIEDD